jgi:hypothetical protein
LVNSGVFNNLKNPINLATYNIKSIVNILEWKNNNCYHKNNNYWNS